MPFVLDFNDAIMKELKIEMDFDEYRSIGANQFYDIKNRISDNYFDLFSKNELDGTKLQDDWFPDLSEYNIDVFLSHSHGDIEYVEAFAGWLKSKLGLSSFIDADVWRNIEDLEEKINEIANQPRKRAGINVYDYSNTRGMFQHTNAMLSVALQKMIDKAEIVIFLASSNSVKIHAANKLNITFSPWIYSELSCMKTVRRKKIAEYREHISLLEEQMIRKASIPISYIVDYDSMERLSANDLIEMQRYASLRKENGKKILDRLYQKKCSEIWREYSNNAKGAN